MTIRQIAAFGLLTLVLGSCSSSLYVSNTKETEISSPVKIAGAMKNVMWEGQLGSSIDLDTISNKKGLYGLGPLAYLAGELLINDGKSYVSKATSDSTMIVEEQFDVSAAFFVYGNVNEWTQEALPPTVKSCQDLEKYIHEKTQDIKKPFAFKLLGKISNAIIHVQNLPKGAKVSSPTEAHQGQVNFTLKNEEAEIIGFFSTEHKGVFTHHDSFLHMHLITKDLSMMGHLDVLEIDKMFLYLPKSYPK